MKAKTSQKSSFNYELKPIKQYWDNMKDGGLNRGLTVVSNTLGKTYRYLVEKFRNWR